MKSLLSMCFALAVCFCFSTAGYSAETTTRISTGGPMPEMLLYEAAEQAVEDGYARIVPDSEVKNEGDLTEQTGQVNSKPNPEHQGTKPTPTQP